MTELLPCPFCGGEPKLHKNDPYMDDRESNNVRCINCNAAPRVSFFPTADEAILVWNTRAPTAREAELQALLDKAVGFIEQLANHPTGGMGCNPQGFVLEARATLDLINKSKGV